VDERAHQPVDEAVATTGSTSAVTAGGEVRRIWLCADDYGISPSVDQAIRDLVTRRRINATSVMVAAPSFTRSEARSLAILNSGGQHAAIGLHVTLTAPFRPLTKDYAPTRGGCFLPIAETLRLAVLRKLDPAALAREVAAQLAAFAAAFGHVPDFVDGHQHVQLLPQVRDAVLEAARERAPGAWARQGGGAGPWWRRLGDRKGLVVGYFSRGFRRRAKTLGVATNPAFAGTYSFVPDADFSALFPTFLDGLPDGGLIMCHPGFVDAELARLDPLTGLREKEHAYLAGDAFVAALAARRVALA
jgi:predicted glycoside hydrolase/deacetylase ChbG (UPF0249 family)